jgi:phage terminase large subunit
MKLKFDAHGNAKQVEAWEYWTKPGVDDIVYGGSKGSGKSFLGCSIIFSMALMYPGTQWFIARKTLNDLRKHTTQSIAEVLQGWGCAELVKFNGQDNKYICSNGSQVMFLDAKYLPSDPTYARFGSIQMTGGWIEEAGEFDSDAKSALMACVGRWKNDEYNIEGKLLQTCNPMKNYLYTDFYKPAKEGTLDANKAFIQALPTDNKRLAKGYLDRLNRTLSPEAKQRLLFGNWEYEDDPNALCSYDSIVNIFGNKSISGKKYITADIARFGADKAIIAVWDNWNIIEIKVFDVSSTVQIQDAIKDMMKRHAIPTSQVIADEDGVGGGVVDNLRIKGFKNGSKPFQNENYFNLQSQCGFKLAERINSGDLGIDIEIEQKYKDEIIEELEQLKRLPTPTGEGKLRILTKDEVKRNIGRSPDWRDLLLMRAYFDYKKYFKVY